MRRRSHIQSLSAAAFGFVAALSALTLLGALVFAELPEAAAGTPVPACAAFPSAPWWSGLSHAKGERHVARKHGGDWRPYIAKWERQQAKLENVLWRGSSVVIRGRGVRLGGQRLARYIRQVEARLAVSRCLAGGGPIAGSGK